MTTTPQDVHLDEALTNVSVAYIQKSDVFVSTKVFPMVNVEKQSDVYYTMEANNRDEGDNLLRAPGTEPRKTTTNFNTDKTFFCKNRALAEVISMETERNADAQLNLDTAAVHNITNGLFINREKNFVTKFLSQGIWGEDLVGNTSVSVSGTNVKQWSDVTSTPIEDIEDLKLSIAEKYGFMPNIATMGARVFSILKNHPDVVDRIKYSGGVGNDTPAIATLSALASVIGVEKVVVMNSIENTAKEGQTHVGAFIGGKFFGLFYAPSAAGRMIPSAGYTFNWDATGSGLGNDGIIMRSHESTKLQSRTIEGQTYYDQRVVDANLGGFIRTVIA